MQDVRQIGLTMHLITHTMGEGINAGAAMIHGFSKRFRSSVK
jgi:hypothetical protein